MKAFIELIERKGYPYKKDGDMVVILGGYVDLRSLTTLPENVKFENQGSVYLSSLTTLPENVKFENQGYVYLSSLTTLPENVKFENQGSVDLRSLTTLPENVKFENQGSVYLSSLTTLLENVKFENQGSVDLRSLTTLPENVKFENQGSVYLRSLTTLPENVKFENQGYVYLSSLNNKPIKYRGKNLTIRIIDGDTMLCKTHKEADGFKITKSMYFKGGEIKNLPTCFIAEKDGFFAHGETLQKAIEDVNFKYLQKNLNKKELVAQIKKRGTVTKNDYRLLTGSCQMGVNMFCKEFGIDVDELPIEKVLRLTEGRYGHSTFKELLGNIAS